MNLASLSQYSKHKDGTYVSFQMDGNTRALLDRFVEINLGLAERVASSTYHITVIYSRTPVPAAEDYSGNSTAVASAVAYEVFPTKDGDKCLVLRINSAEASTLNNHLTKLGATSDYDEYKPHVTIAYNAEMPEDLTILPLPQFPLVFDRIEVEPLDPLYVPSNN
jgi:hypothetical protein